MKYLFQIVLILLASSVMGQVYFNRTYDVDGFAEIGSKIIVEDTSYLIGCECYYNGVDHLGFNRINEIGDSLRLTHFGNDSLSYFIGNHTGVVNKKSNYYTVAGVWDHTSFDNDLVLIKIDSAGLDTVWMSSYDIENFEFAVTLITTNDNGFLLGGFAQPYDGSNFGYPYWFVIKTDSLGNEQWRNTYIQGKLQQIIQSVDGNYILAGWYQPNSGFDYQMEVIKIDSAGGIIWQKRFGTSEGEGINGIVELEDSSLIVYGNRLDTGELVYSYYLGKLDYNGVVIWEKIYGNTNTGSNNVVRNLEALPDGSFIASGQGEPSGTNSTYTRGTILKFCPNGELLWERKYGHPDVHSYLYDIELTDDGGFVATGSTRGASGTQDLWVIKVDSLGCDTPGCAQPPDPCPEDTIDTTSIPERLHRAASLALYPNPAKSFVNVHYRFIFGESKKMIKIANLVTGQEIYSLDIEQQKGVENISTSNYSNGIYVIQLVEDNAIISSERLIVFH